MPLPRITPSTRRILLLCLIGALAVMYGISWFAPAIGLAYSDGAVLAAALRHDGGGGPPLLPFVLAVFALVSHSAPWLKLAPLICTLVWLWLARRLLLKMGASTESSWMMVAMTAASPTVLYLGTGLFAEPLFALLITWSLLLLLEEKPLLAGICAGLATITFTPGATLIAACLITLVATRRFRSAILFTCSAMLFAAPWLGWALAHGGLPFTRLHGSELAAVTGSNAAAIAGAPFILLSGYQTFYPALLTAVAILIVLVRRRHFLPDLFVGFYCLALLLRIEPPVASFAPVLPLVLWMLWRVVRKGRFTAISLVVAAMLVPSALWFNASRLAAAPPDDWHQMQTLFAFIRGNTAPDAVLMADLDPVFEVQTGRHTVRGFVPDLYREHYGPATTLVTPDQLLTSLLRDHVDYVVLTPDRDTPESLSFHNAVAAMERAGDIEPVSVPGTTGAYRLLRVTKQPRLLRPGAGISR